jgi:hypothetical protein
VKWLDRERGIVLWQFDDLPTLETIVSDYGDYQALVAASKHATTPTIVDLTRVRRLPHNIVSRFPSMMEELPRPNDSTDTIAVVHSGLFVRSITNMFSRYSGHQFVFFHSVDAAHQYLLGQIDPPEPPAAGH